MLGFEELSVADLREVDAVIAGIEATLLIPGPRARKLATVRVHIIRLLAMLSPPPALNTSKATFVFGASMTR